MRETIEYDAKRKQGLIGSDAAEINGWIQQQENSSEETSIATDDRQEQG